MDEEKPYTVLFHARSAVRFLLSGKVLDVLLKCASYGQLLFPVDVLSLGLGFFGRRNIGCCCKRRIKS